MVFIQDIVRGTELTIASGGPPGGLPNTCIARAPGSPSCPSRPWEGLSVRQSTGTPLEESGPAPRKGQTKKKKMSAARPLHLK